MLDRVSTYPGRVKLTPVAGQANTYDLTMADQPTQEGTPLNKANLLSDATAISFNLDPETATVDDALSATGKAYILVLNFTSDLSIGASYSVSSGDETYNGTVPNSKTVRVRVEKAEAKYTVSYQDSVGQSSIDVLTGRYFGEYPVNIPYYRTYGALWDGTSTTKWSRTGNASGFTDPVPYVAGAANYGSPFDTIQPWAGMVKENRTGGVMVKIPKFWYRLTQNSNNLEISISPVSIPNYYVSPAHMDRGDGKGERNVVYIGRYHCASDFKSKTGVVPKVNTTRANFRTGIHNLGANIWQGDFAMRFTMWLLYIVEFANWNSQEKIGYGCGNNSALENMGSTNSMPYHTGTMKSSRTEYGVGVQYRYIEDPWGNCYDWYDGCYNNSSGLNIILKPNNFSDSSGGVSVGVPSSGWPSAFSVKTNAGFPLFIPTAASGSDSTYSCDYWSFGASSPVVCGGGSYGQNLHRGLFFVSYASVSGASADLGSRLQELP